MKGSIKAGYESRQFSNDKPAADSPVVEATLDQRFSDRTTVSLIYSRRNSLSVQVAGDGYTADAISGQLAWVRLGTNGFSTQLQIVPATQ